MRQIFQASLFCSRGPGSAFEKGEGEFSWLVDGKAVLLGERTSNMDDFPVSALFVVL